MRDAPERYAYEMAPVRNMPMRDVPMRDPPMRDMPMRWPMGDTRLWEGHSYERCTRMRGTP
jgi:hypothetical protein